TARGGAARGEARALFSIMSAMTPIAGVLAALALAAAPPRHLIYLHGRIVQEQQSARPVHPRFGAYELEKILAALRERGFAVTGGIRAKSETIEESAERVATEVRKLLASGVPPDSITVVGASMGASIALEASRRLKVPELRFCLIGACRSGNVGGT